MIIAASSTEAASRRQVNENNANRLDASGKPTASARTTFIGLDPRQMKGKDVPHPNALSPMAYRVEEDAGSVLNAHFHKADQFQIFTKGDGKLGGHPIKSLCIQFTGAGSAYGPIVAGPGGLDYFTFRNTYTAKAWFMPASRDELKASPRHHREVFGDVAAPRSDEELMKATSVEESHVIEKTDDGLLVWRYLVPPGQSATGPAPSSGSGQFWMVLAGDLEDKDNGPMPKSSCVFVSHDEAAYIAKAGPKGLDVLVAQFPVKEYQH